MITTTSSLSELPGLRLNINEILPDIAPETYGADSIIGYTYAATTIQNCSPGENVEITPNTFQEAMTLRAEAQWKAVSDKEVA